MEAFQMAGKITVINPVHDDSPLTLDGVDNRHRIVAAYCRVSTDEDEQLNSYDNQINEWTSRIQNNPNYTLFKVYGDGGITGTSAKQRPQFQKMLSDAEKGKFDLILCKSISRFARNTVLTLSTIKKLKEQNVEIYFDNEHMSTFDPKNEFMFTIMSSMAQEESRHISENVRWTIRIKMENGEAFGNGPYGYKISKQGKRHFVLDGEKAEIMKQIFDWFDNGYGLSSIIEMLRERKIPSPKGRKRWHEDTLIRQLKNPAYKGTLVLQKTYTVDYIGHVKANNLGQRRQYIIEDAHKPIVSKEQWERVNNAIKGHYLENAGEDVQDVMKYKNKGPLSGLIICGLCNKTYKRRHMYDKSYKEPRIAYQCNGYIDKSECGRCQSKGISENVLFAAIANMLNNIYASKEKYFEFLKEAFLKRYHLQPLEAEIKKISDLKEKTKKRIKEVRIQQIEDEGKKDISALQIEEETLVDNYQKLETLYQELKCSKSITEIKNKAFSKILKVFEGQNVTYQDMADFPIHAIVEYIKVIDKHNIIIFLNGTGNYNHVEAREMIPSENESKSIFDATVRIKNPRKTDMMHYYVKII